jgi:Flp pilus assembly protein TadG
MTNVQLYFAIGVPTFAVLVGIVIGFFQSNHAVNQNAQALNQALSQLNLRFTSLENTMNTRFSILEGRFNLMDSDMKTLVRASNDLHVRLARLEERLAR